MSDQDISQQHLDGLQEQLDGEKIEVEKLKVDRDQKQVHRDGLRAKYDSHDEPRDVPQTIRQLLRDADKELEKAKSLHGTSHRLFLETRLELAELTLKKATADSLDSIEGFVGDTHKLNKDSSDQNKWMFRFTIVIVVATLINLWIAFQGQTINVEQPEVQVEHDPIVIQHNFPEPIEEPTNGE